MPDDKAAPSPVTPTSVIDNVFISQVYAGGSSEGATLTHDYIEIFNASNMPVNIDGWAVQYAYTSTLGWQVTPLRGSIAPGGYYLVQGAAGSAQQAPMAGVVDARGTIAMAPRAGRVALTQYAAPLTVMCPSGFLVVDRVSYGDDSSTSDCAAEWGARTGRLSSTTAAYRNNDGCANTGSNADDFTVLVASPRSSASPPKSCGADIGTSGGTLGIDHVSISQVFGGGGNSGAALAHDYVEIFNGGNTPVNLTGWAVQYASAAGTAWQVTPLRGVIPAGGYFLVQEAAGSMGEAPMLAKADATGTISMTMSTGKVALTQNTTPLTVTCPSGPLVVDRVSYGDNTPASGGCSAEWGGRTGLLSSTTAAYRNSDGCANTGNNADDFTVLAANPRNSASPPKFCATDAE